MKLNLLKSPVMAQPSFCSKRTKPLLGTVKFISDISNRNNLGQHAVRMIDSAQNEAFIDYTDTCSFMIIEAPPRGQDPPGPQYPWAGPTALET